MPFSSSILNNYELQTATETHSKQYFIDSYKLI